jgi:C1A family cysteine protease
MSLINKSRKLKHGWQPDLPDHRDIKYAVPTHLLTTPPSIDLRSKCPSVYDQGDLGSCTANAIAAAIEFDLLKQKLPNFIPSRLFIYFNERAMEGTIASDSGAQIRDGIKSVNVKGVCHENTWPYIEDKFTIPPSSKAYGEAWHHKTVSYQSITQNQAQIKGCLAAGYPIVFGFTVYDAFESEKVATTGILNLPAPNESVVGGHAVLIVGYNDTAQRFIVRNSWGSNWGLKGYFTIPYAYVTNSDLADDFWTIKVVK